ncbi:MAG: CIA30 family protein [Natronohydrobacter sp.]|nr:CIA30 family protein [Natronohydrobacter sp.]
MDPAGGCAGANQPCETARVILEQGRGPGLLAETGQQWRCVSDQVMGGVSRGQVQRARIDGESALHLTGTVSLENNGGFLQMALALSAPGEVLDASGYHGLELRVRGNGARYNLHLRSADMTAVWQSWRISFETCSEWRDLTLPFAQFTPHRTDLPVNPARLTRLGLVAIGQVMQVDLALSRLALVADQNLRSQNLRS